MVKYNKKQRRYSSRRLKRQMRQGAKEGAKELARMIDEDIINNLLKIYIPFSRKDVNGI